MNDELLSKINELESKIEKYNKAYYDENKTLISDFEYDLMKRELTKLRLEFNKNDNKNQTLSLFGENIDNLNIENKVGFKANEKFKKITHKKRMASLDNALNIDEFYDFTDKVKRFLNISNFPESVCELKIDGLSFSAMYNKGRLKYVATRGDGQIGEDVSENVLQISNFPKELNDDIVAKLDEFEVRGEIYMPKDKFEEINSKLSDKDKFSNPRNMASGTLRQLNPEIVKQRGLKYYSYFIGECSEKIVNSQIEALNLLEKLGFNVNSHKILAKTEQDIIKFHTDISNIRYELDCDIDGIVIKINDFKLQEQLGNTAHSPRWAIAYKFSGLTAMTKITGITNQVGRTGIITPVAELSPINIGGVIVKRATLHNYDEIERLNLHINDIVEIKRSGDVIPKIIAVDKHANNGIKITKPTHCPCCGSKLIKNDEFVAIYCPNKVNCKEQIVDKIRHFASRNGFDITGLGRQIIAKFYDLGFLHDILDIFDLQKHSIEMQNLDGFGIKSTKNLLDAIENSKNIEFHKVLFALGINEIGENVAKILSKYYSNFNDIIEDKQQFSKILGINGLGEQVIISLKSFFNNDNNLNIIQQLNNIIKIKINNNSGVNNSLNGKSVVFTGKLQNMTRQQAKQQAEQLGYKVLVAVSSNTDYLVYGLDAGATKLNKAKEMGIKVITEEEWLNINKNNI